MNKINKNVIFFPLYIYDVKSCRYYSALYNALWTIKKHNAINKILKKNQSTYDIVVYYYIDENLNISQSEILEGRHNIIEDFKDVKFVEFKYQHKENDVSDKFFYKWKALDRLIYESLYENFLILDADIYFFDDPGFLFEKYKTEEYPMVDTVYGLQEGTPVEFREYFKKASVSGYAFNGGQILVSRNICENIGGMADQMNIAKEYLLKENEKVKAFNSQKHFKFLSDQYAMSFVFSEAGVSFKNFSSNDFAYKNEPEIIQEMGKFYITCNAKIYHYMNTCIDVVVGKDLKKINNKLNGMRSLSDFLEKKSSLIKNKTKNKNKILLE